MAVDNGGRLAGQLTAGGKVDGANQRGYRNLRGSNCGMSRKSFFPEGSSMHEAPDHTD